VSPEKSAEAVTAAKRFVIEIAKLIESAAKDAVKRGE
jgi:hypothetical protein